MVKGGLDQTLDELQDQYRELPSHLSAVVQRLASQIDSTTVKSINVVYFPQLGFLITIPLADSIVPPDLGLDPELYTLQFATERVAYYKDEEMRHLDSSIGDIYGEMVDREVELIRCVIEQVLPLRRQLIAYSETFAELDWY